MKTFYGSIQEYLEELDVKLEKQHGILQEDILDTSRINTGKPILVDVNGIDTLVGLVPSRRMLYRSLKASSDVEAYNKIIRAEEEAQKNHARNVDLDFKDFFTRIDDGESLLKRLSVRVSRETPPYITSSAIIACMDNVCNMSIHRIMVANNYVAVRVVPRHLFRMLSQSPEGLKVAVAIGLHPLVLLAAATSPPYGVFELNMVPYLAEAPLAVCRTPNYRIPVPCGASYVFEAILGPRRASEGPFIDILGTKDIVRSEPVMDIEAAYINTRFKPYNHIIIPGSCEHMLLMGFPREAHIFRYVASVAEVVKVRLTPSSGMWLHAIVAIRKRVEGEAVNAGIAALSAHPSLKLVIVVDDDIDPDNLFEVEWAIATRVRWGKDVNIIHNVRGSSLDPSSADGLTDKIVIDATMPVKDRERFRRIIPFTHLEVKPPCT